MDTKSKRSYHPLLVLGPLLVFAALGVYSSTSSHFFLPGAICSFFILMILPGASIYLLTEKRPRVLELSLSALALSPVLVCSAGALLMLSGFPSQRSATLLLLFSTLLGARTLRSRRPSSFSTGLSGRHVLVLAASALFFCLLSGYLPLTREWWRVRSDAWFHAATIAQIDTYGIPPEDAYFAGLDLQYMWFYHLLVLFASKATRVEPFFVMPIINLQALVGFVLATYLLATSFRKTFAHGFSSVLTVMLGMNALFWLFLPIKTLKAFVGETRGMEELARILSLSPLDIHRVRSFLNIYNNQVFFLDKFIVSTAFSLGLFFLASFWYGSTRYLSTGRPLALLVAFFSMVGMLAFHTMVGFVMLAGLFGALVLIYRSRIDDLSRLRTASLASASLLGLFLLSPYLYSIMHLKETEQVIPLDLSLKKTGGIFISCALVIVLSVFQVRRLIAKGDIASRYFLFSTLSIGIFCLIITLPGPNVFDKLPFFIFYPLAVMGGWTLLEIPRGNLSPARQRALIVLAFIVLLLPVNIVAMLGYVHTPSRERLDGWEKQVASWVARNTPRDAVFIDRDKEVFLLVAGPRRSYYALESYAKQWGYKRDEMKRRKHVRDNLYSKNELDSLTLHTLGTMTESLYVIARDLEGHSGGMEKFTRYPELFRAVFTAGPITVLEVDKRACLEASRGLLPLSE